MKKFIAFTAILTLLISCGKSGDKGELVGVKGAKWHPEKPFGMSLVSGGSFIMGKSDQDLAGVEDAPTKTVTVPSFYMDETEITNSEYRQFVEWVKDSTMRMRLAILADENGQKAGDGKGKGKNSGSIGDFAFNDTDPEKMTAYEKYINEEDDDAKTGFLKEHVNSIKRHVEQLGGKNYQDLYQIESPDFVLLFIPIESAFAVALNEDTTLYNKAFEKNIVIVTPSTLLATLRTIDSMWTNQKQQENAFEIARQAGALYDKFEGFVTDLIRIGKKIDESKTEYDGAMNKLKEGKGNLITSVEKLKKMGAKAKKALPENILNRAEKDENQLLN